MLVKVKKLWYAYRDRIKSLQKTEMRNGGCFPGGEATRFCYLKTDFGIIYFYLYLNLFRSKGEADNDRNQRNFPFG